MGRVSPKGRQNEPQKDWHVDTPWTDDKGGATAGVGEGRPHRTWCGDIAQQHEKMKLNRTVDHRVFSSKWTEI